MDNGEEFKSFRSNSIAWPVRIHILRKSEKLGYDGLLLSFPYNMQMVALREEGTNWVVIQSSTHMDIFDSLCNGSRCTSSEVVPFVQDGLQPRDMFEHSREHALDFIEYLCSPLGVVQETVGSCFTKRLAIRPREPKLEPEIPLHRFKFISNFMKNMKPIGSIS